MSFDHAFQALEPRRLMAQHPLAVNFNDEALWGANFDSAVAQAKSLGIKAVRVWLGFEGYSDRPNAYDPTFVFGSVIGGGGLPSENDAAQAMKRAFDLKDAGFTVLLGVNDSTDEVPTSAAQVKAFYQHLMDAPETPGGKRTLADVVDYWEVGNEPDSGNYWPPSLTNKTTGLQAYVDKLLIPAGQALHAEGEKVVSAGVSHDPNDLKTILARLKTQNQLTAIDYAGFHPYGTSTPGGASQVVDNSNAALAISNSYGKSMIATEWNVRGFGTSGSNNAAWAAAMNDAFHRAIDTDYTLAFYFALVNNWAGRGGTTSARPGGLLRHTYGGAVVPTSSIPTLQTYYESSLVAASPFYSTFAGWNTQAATYGSVSGSILGAGTAASSLTSVRAYVDLNNDATYDGGEPYAYATAAGTYKITYASSAVPTGTYMLRIAMPSTLKAVTGSLQRMLSPTSALTGADFTVAPVASGSIAGKVTPQSSAWEKEAEGTLWTVFLDQNRNGTRDAGEAYKTFYGNTTYQFTGLSAGVYTVRLASVGGWGVVTPSSKTYSVTLTSGQAATGKTFVVKKT